MFSSQVLWNLKSKELVSQQLNSEVLGRIQGISVSLLSGHSDHTLCTHLFHAGPISPLCADGPLLFYKAVGPHWVRLFQLRLPSAPSLPHPASPPPSPSPSASSSHTPHRASPSSWVHLRGAQQVSPSAGQGKLWLGVVGMKRRGRGVKTPQEKDHSSYKQGRRSQTSKSHTSHQSSPGWSLTPSHKSIPALENPPSIAKHHYWIHLNIIKIEAQHHCCESPQGRWGWF